MNGFYDEFMNGTMNGFYDTRNPLFNFNTIRGIINFVLYRILGVICFLYDTKYHLFLYTIRGIICFYTIR